MEGAAENSDALEILRSHELKIDHCAGCLRCNILKRCSLHGDEWEGIAEKIEQADVLVFAAPVYFHHVPGPMKVMLDRFRSFIHVQMTPTGLIYTPHKKWKKDFVLILTMGSSDVSDADPIIELFEFIRTMLGAGNNLHVITATRLGVIRQVIKTEEELRLLYEKLKLPVEQASEDAVRNLELLDECRQLGVRLSE